MTARPALADITQGRDPGRVEEAIAALRDDVTNLVEIVIERYEGLMLNPHRRDPGAYMRTVLMRGLKGLARPRDLPIVEAATYVYETMPRSVFDVAGNLRGAALLVLSDIDERLALFHAARFLADPGTSHMSGQPGITAVQLLRANDQFLPLYVFLSGDVSDTGEVAGECLAALGNAPDSIVHGLVDRFRDEDDDAVRAGLFDLLLARPDDAWANEELERFVRDGEPDAVYAYVVKTIVATRRVPLIEVMRGVHATTGGIRHRLLTEALDLRPA
jgi:hypothetical protein